MTNFSQKKITVLLLYVQYDFRLKEKFNKFFKLMYPLNKAVSSYFSCKEKYDYFLSIYNYLQVILTMLILRSNYALTLDSTVLRTRRMHYSAYTIKCCGASTSGTSTCTNCGGDSSGCITGICLFICRGL